MTVDRETAGELRAQLVEAKLAVKEALIKNAKREDAGRAPRHSADDLAALRLAVDMAALAARQAEVDISDLVGPAVGRL